jgi:hypothetical protein
MNIISSPAYPTKYRIKLLPLSFAKTPSNDDESSKELIATYES